MEKNLDQIWIIQLRIIHTVGHAVRAVYMYIAMADLTRETGDKWLLDVCKRL